MDTKPKSLKEQFKEKQKERDREIVRLHTQEGMTYEEIAKKFGITKQRVEQIINSR